MLHILPAPNAKEAVTAVHAAARALLSAVTVIYHTNVNIVKAQPLPSAINAAEADISAEIAVMPTLSTASM